MELCYRNFRDWLNAITHNIQTSNFVAIDYEFLGIPSVETTVSLFDTPEERYRKNREVIAKFPPCQMGLACFRETSNPYELEVDVFCFYVMKRQSRKEFNFSTSAVKFLAKHNFDFNKFVSDGITFANRAEIMRIKKDIETKRIDYDMLEDYLEYRLRQLRLRVIAEASNCAESYEQSGSRRHRTTSSANEVRFVRPCLIDLVAGKNECTYGASREPLWDRDLTPIEVAVVLYELTVDFPNVDFAIQDYRLYCADIPHLYRLQYDSTETRIQQRLNEVLLQISGISQIMQIVSEFKIPVVAHNAYIDILETYHFFENDLPESYSVFKQALHKMLPVIIDTRTIASEVQQTLHSHGVKDFSLQNLVAFFESPSCGDILPFRTPRVVGGEHSSGIYEPGEHYHNAAFDALVTGELFIKLAYLFCYDKKAGNADFSTPWPLKRLIASLKDVSNRIPVPLIDSVCCDLLKQDQVGNRPAVMQVTQKHDVPTWLPQFITTRYAEKCIALVTWLFGHREICAADAEHFRLLVRQRFGAHRVDSRIGKDSRSIEVATNTPNTFSKVCTWIITTDCFELPPHIAALSHEERMMGAAGAKKFRSRKIHASSTSTPSFLTLASLLTTSSILAFLTYRYLRQ